ncbi:HAD-superfamily hydrolase, subfamily IIB [uncultured Alphaproteobacteria bacterium]|uniref:HAD-superfamily hydrolase, subfamily IIB n=1 Tax=uncultured Alphaproteobacteria bacterium TaxID=91750 RepID=A0A212JBD1_9PROT|nr:HAD-superfamily hydrolase, subfamily IIB [uncultured Alphaproteobacteria bacterium]
MKLLLCCDLDRTLIPNGPQTLSDGAMDALHRLAARPEVTLAFVTGRSRTLVERAILKWRLPVPDVVAGDVGTSIYDVGPDRLWREWDAWAAVIAPDWNGRTHADLAAALEGLDDLNLQGADGQSRFKLSYTAPATADAGALVAAAAARLAPLGVNAEVTWSVDETVPIGLVDILPKSASKQGAVDCIRRERDFPPERTVFAGDSGNDLPVLAGPLRAILVANATDTVRTRALELAAANGKTDDLYLARGGFRGMNGCYAAGVLEGLTHFYPEVWGWLD